MKPLTEIAKQGGMFDIESLGKVGESAEKKSRSNDSSPFSRCYNFSGFRTCPVEKWKRLMEIYVLGDALCCKAPVPTTIGARTCPWRFDRRQSFKTIRFGRSAIPRLEAAVTTGFAAPPSTLNLLART